MTEIQRLLTETIESLNTREKRDNKPRFSISFIRKHPGLFIGMYVAFFATLAVIGFAPIFPDTCYHLTHYWP
uniref:YlaC family protein n=1 Tax=Escherichia coli TaxID=562 RepID=UPI00201B27CA